jgi:5-methylthioadenosine/S-adenosylhomocysteine deaminase
MTLLRGYVDNVALMDWLQNYIWPAEGKFVNAEYVRDGTELAVAEMIRAGVTTFLDMYFFPAVTAEVVDRMGVRAGISVPILMHPTPWAKDEDDALAKGRVELLTPYQSHPRIRPFLAPHAPYTVSDEGFRKVVATSAELNVPINTHLHETDFEVNSVPERPFKRLHALGVLGPRTVCAHMCHLTAEEVAQAAAAGISVVHCPCSNLKLASGLCPVKELLEAGVNVCMGTDGAGSNDDLDMMSEMKSAAFISKLRAQSPVALPAHTLVEMATINGAKALGWEKTIGSLEVGKQADVVAIHLRNTPIFDVHSALVYVGTNVVTNVWVAGKQLLRDGKLVGVDEEALIAKGNVWGERMKVTAVPK